MTAGVGLSVSVTAAVSLSATYTISGDIIVSLATNDYFEFYVNSPSSGVSFGTEAYTLHIEPLE